jgi:hypothetical protein
MATLSASSNWRKRCLCAPIGGVLCHRRGLLPTNNVRTIVSMAIQKQCLPLGRSSLFRPRRYLKNDARYCTYIHFRMESKKKAPVEPTLCDFLFLQVPFLFFLILLLQKLVMIYQARCRLSWATLTISLSWTYIRTISRVVYRLLLEHY